MRKDSARLTSALLVVAFLWFFMFSPWTGRQGNFWVNMSISAAILSLMAFSWTGIGLRCPGVREALFQFMSGVLIAAALWGIFWVGDKVSQFVFSFARSQVDSVYAMKTGSDAVLVAVLLILVIGPAEEFFWRGYVQRSFAGRIGDNAALVVTTLVYALVHVWSFNFMLVAAALTAGSVWGIIYRLKPSLLPALIVSHALWDAAVFVIFPIG